MIPYTCWICRCRSVEKTNSSGGRSIICGSNLSLREYTAKDRNVVIEIFKEGILDGIDRAKDDKIYYAMETWINSVLYKYDDVPTMVYARNGGKYFVARDENNEIVGTVGIVVSNEDLEKKRGELVRLSVRNKSRGLGYGRFLLVFLINYAKSELKLSTLHLEMTNVFGAACALYEKLRFKQVHRTFNSNGSIDILMELDWNSVEFPSTISLRDYTAEDRTIAIDMFKEAMIGEVDRENYPIMYKRTVAWVDSILYRYDDVSAMVYAKNGGRLWFARVEMSKVVGSVGIIVSDEDIKRKQGELIRLSVRTEFRGRGIGTFLVKFLINYARDQLGLSAIHLETTLTRAAAISLYEKFGFKEIRRELWVMKNQALAS